MEKRGEREPIASADSYTSPEPTRKTIYPPRTEKLAYDTNESSEPLRLFGGSLQSQGEVQFTAKKASPPEKKKFQLQHQLLRLLRNLKQFVPLLKCPPI